MPDLACAVIGTAVHLPVDNNTAPDSRTHRHIEDGGVAASPAEPVFCERARVRVVLKRHRDMKFGFQHRFQG